jgi:uncharacterized protein
LAGEQTVPPDKGLFLEETWRLHPDICAYTSELFYSGKLRAHAGLEKQAIKSAGPLSGSGLRYLPVAHSGNQNCSPEEAQAIATLVNTIMNGSTWIDGDGQEKAITFEDIVIITPYNAQVFEIQQAAVAIYSMATSSHADAPRGMEFLYSLNRLNVATSRAKCISVIVGSPQIAEAECHTPRQMQLVNALCRYLELATPIQ